MRRFFHAIPKAKNKELLFNCEDLVRAAYRALLARDPDIGGLEYYSDGIRQGRGLSWLLECFVRSKEFVSYHSNEDVAHECSDETASSMNVQFDGIGPDEQAALWNHIAAIWAKLGSTDPYGSVLTGERWRTENIMAEETLEAFYSTGEGDFLRLDHWLRRNSIKMNGDAVCAEYGCGVGRVTQWLAKRFRRVAAFDVSEPHIRAAQQRLSKLGINNVDFVLIRKLSDLAKLSNFDVFFSLIVLQHNPPPVIADILSTAFAGLNESGYCFFQVPTFSAAYEFSLSSYWSNEGESKEMEMHFFPQKIVFDLGRKYKVYPVEIQRDDCVGKRKDWISTTFLMGKGKD
jgi:SAM-dependent methyltransferase